MNTTTENPAEREMTKKNVTGGQSLLVSGALRMARSKRSNSNYQHPKLAAIRSQTCDIQAAIESHLEQARRNLSNQSMQQQVAAAAANDNHMIVQQQPNQEELLSDSHESGSRSSMSGLSSPSPSLLHLQDSTYGEATPTSGLHVHGIKLQQAKSEEQLHKRMSSNSSSSSSSINNNNNSNSNSNSNQNNKGKSKKLFPFKLWDLINDGRYNFCLRWSDDGQMVYLNRDQFEDSYLKTIGNKFHTKKAISFVRQLNMYGFRKVDDCYYENDNFKRGCEHLLKNMIRKHSSKLTAPASAAATTATTTTTSTASESTVASSLISIGNALVEPIAGTSDVDAAAFNTAEIPHPFYHKSLSNNQDMNINHDEHLRLRSRHNNNNHHHQQHHHQNEPLDLHRSQLIEQLQQVQQRQQQQLWQLNDDGRLQIQQQQQLQQDQQLQQSQVATIQWLIILVALSYNLGLHGDNLQS